MENDEENTMDKEPSPPPAGAEEKHEVRYENADNHDLGPWEELPVGNVPEVNGRWAQEVKDFVPTCWELLVVAEHWAGVAIERTYVEWANANVSVSTKHWWRVYFAWRRVYRIRGLLGDIIDRVIDDQIKKFRDEHRAWDPKTWKEFSRLIDPEARKEHLAPISNDFPPPLSKP